MGRIMSESTNQPLSLSLEVKMTVVEDGNLLPYYVDVVILTGNNGPAHHSVRLDMMYEQVQTLVDNHLRQMTGKLSAAMREQRKQTLK